MQNLTNGGTNLANGLKNLTNGGLIVGEKRDQPEKGYLCLSCGYHPARQHQQVKVT